MISNVMENLTLVKESHSTSRALRSGSERELEFRCPQCFKLYKTTSSDIYSSEPQFECEICHALFSFAYPPANPKAIYTKTLTLPQVGRLAKKVVQNPSIAPAAGVSNPAKAVPELISCAKCGTSNPRGVQDCLKCGVVLSKAQIQAQHLSLPSLVRMWQELIHDYENLTKHMAFVDRCEDLQALPFALKKYKDLKAVQPQDEVASQMFKSVLFRVVSRQVGRVRQIPGLRALSKIKNWPWDNILRTAPVVVGFGLVLAGGLKLANPNFVGGGVALLFLYLGTFYFAKGRLSWRDFWDSSR